MQVLITGGAGFIGSHMVECLLRQGHRVIILDRLDETVNLTRLNLIPDWEFYIKNDRVKIVWWDLKAGINKQTSDKIGQVDWVLHFAAGSHVDRSIHDPLLFTMDNVVGTCNLLSWIASVEKRPKLIHASTDEVFGASKSLYGYQEEDALTPENPYAATKAGAEALVRAFACTYSLTAMVIRMTNIIGPRQHPEKYIPKVIRQISNQEEVLIHADLSGNISSRFYLDYRDLCSAMNILLNSPRVRYLSKERRDQGVYHIAGIKEISNLDVAFKIAKILDKELKYKLISYDPDRPNHDMSYRLSALKMYNMGWYPDLDIDRSLSDIVDWYKYHPDWL